MDPILRSAETRLSVSFLAVGSSAGTLWCLGLPAFVLILAMTLAWGLHVADLRRSPPPPARVLPIYFAALAWQFVHCGEEFATGFHRVLPERLGFHAWSDVRFLSFNLAFYVLFALAGVAIRLGNRTWSYFATFFILAQILTNVGHLSAVVLDGGQYFPGAYTAPIGLGFGIVLWRRSHEAPAW